MDVLDFYDKQIYDIVSKSNFSQIDIDLIHQYILMGANIDYVDNIRGWTPLMAASWYCSTNAVNLLIRFGATVNFQNNRGETALMFAFINCSTSQKSSRILNILIERGGADVNLQNNRGETALMIACKKGKLGAVKILIRAGADFNLQNNRGETALMIARRMRLKDDFWAPNNIIEIIRILERAENKKLKMIATDGYYRANQTFMGGRYIPPDIMGEILDKAYGKDDAGYKRRKSGGKKKSGRKKSVGRRKSGGRK